MGSFSKIDEYAGHGEQGGRLRIWEVNLYMGVTHNRRFCLKQHLTTASTRLTGIAGRRLSPLNFVPRHSSRPVYDTQVIYI